MKIHYGDIILVDLNPVRGAEISKIRPCVVVSRNSVNTYSRFILVVPLTGNVTKVAGCHLIIPASSAYGLEKDSNAMPEQLRALDKVRCIKKKGSLEPFFLEQLEKRILFVLNQKDMF